MCGPKFERHLLACGIPPEREFRLVCHILTLVAFLRPSMQPLPQRLPWPFLSVNSECGWSCVGPVRLHPWALWVSLAHCKAVGVEAAFHQVRHMEEVM